MQKRFRSMPRERTEAVFSILAVQIGINRDEASWKHFFLEISVLGHKKLDLKRLGFPGAWWNEGGSVYPRIVADPSADATQKTQAEVATAAIGRLFEEKGWE